MVLLGILLAVWLAYHRQQQPLQNHSFVYLRDGKVHNLSKSIPDKPGVLWDNGGVLVYQEK